MDEFDIFKLFFKPSKNYVKPKKSEQVNIESYRVEEVKDKEMFDSDEVAKGDDIDSFICCIGLLLTKKPYVGRSGGNAILGGNCLKGNKDTRCPLCRSEQGFFGSKDQANIQDQSIIMKCKYLDGDAEVKMSKFTDHLRTCEHAPYRCLEYPKCNAIIKRKEVQSHKLTCDSVKVRGKYFHSHLMYRKDLQNHEENLGEFKTVPGPGCKVYFYKTALKAHEVDGKDIPIRGVQCHQNVKRKDLEDHDFEGPKALVKGTAYEKGNTKITKEELEHHERQCEYIYEKHKMIIQELEQKIKARDVTIKRLQEKVDEDKDSIKFSFKSLFS